jgi:tagaturonate reductase
MILSKQTLSSVQKAKGLDIPAAAIFSLPEKVLQFGTGVLLRGLPGYFIDKANKQAVFNGRIVMVKSTSQGDTDAFSSQDNLYTQCVRGIDKGEQVDEFIINASVSRVLSAAGSWKKILACAANPQLQVIISNTTEVGITLLDNEDVYTSPPVSFPGKLLAFLLERYTKFNGSAESGMVIIPTELITENGTKLKHIVIELAKQNKLEEGFIKWIATANDFCNSLVDRIVPGKLPAADREVTEARLGFKDDLMIMSEVYRLWAIETTSKRTKEILSFSKTDTAVVIAADIDKFRELKLRLLNGSHSFACAVALLLGFTTVKQAMTDRDFQAFISSLMLDEIVPAIVGEKLSREEALEFSAKVIERYRNPFIEHQWLSISLQYSSKMKLRNVPVLLQYYEKMGTVPQHMALGFAAYLLFMRSVINEKNEYAGELAGLQYIINDDRAARLHGLWSIGGTGKFVEEVLQDKGLWGADLSALPGFTEVVGAYLISIQKEGVMAALKKIKAQKIV